MRFLYNKIYFLLLILISTTVFSAETPVQVNSKSFGYYDLNIGDYSKPREHHYLPEKGVEIIKINQGDVFSITLPASPSTGSSWALRILPTQLLLLDSSYKQSDECKNGIPGCAGFTTYIFKALEKGTGTVKLQYGRQWENGDSNTRTVKVSVK